MIIGGEAVASEAIAANTSAATHILDNLSKTCSINLDLNEPRPPLTRIRFPKTFLMGVKLGCSRFLSRAQLHRCRTRPDKWIRVIIPSDEIVRHRSNLFCGHSGVAG
jgi:hypothetical protein